jgi:hypothetical protein
VRAATHAMPYPSLRRRRAGPPSPALASRLHHLAGRLRHGHWLEEAVRAVVALAGAGAWAAALLLLAG